MLLAHRINRHKTIKMSDLISDVIFLIDCSETITTKTHKYVDHDVANVNHNVIN